LTSSRKIKIDLVRAAVTLGDQDQGRSPWRNQTHEDGGSGRWVGAIAFRSSTPLGVLWPLEPPTLCNSPKISSGEGAPMRTCSLCKSLVRGTRCPDCFLRQMCPLGKAANALRR